MSPTRHQRCAQDNTSWLRLLTHLQADSVPHKCVECLRDLKAMHEAMTIDDIYEAYSQARVTACVRQTSVTESSVMATRWHAAGSISTRLRISLPAPAHLLSCWKLPMHMCVAVTGLRCMPVGCRHGSAGLVCMECCWTRMSTPDIRVVRMHSSIWRTTRYSAVWAPVARRRQSSPDRQGAVHPAQHQCTCKSAPQCSRGQRRQQSSRHSPGWIQRQRLPQLRRACEQPWRRWWQPARQRQQCSGSPRNNRRRYKERSSR